jgi:hypothetical protein
LSAAKALPTPETKLCAALETEPAAVKQPAQAREIRLEVGSDSDRVEVKLSERAGELKVSVRTPDSHLAERLRADLPTLSARLEESGLRAETWRPSVAGGNETRTAHEVSTAGFGDQPRDPESGRQQREQQRHREPQQPRVMEENETSKEKGQEFEWFLSPTQ